MREFGVTQSTRLNPARFYDPGGTAIIQIGADSIDLPSNLFALECVHYAKLPYTFTSQDGSAVWHCD